MWLMSVTQRRCPMTIPRFDAEIILHPSKCKPTLRQDVSTPGIVVETVGAAGGPARGLQIPQPAWSWLATEDKQRNGAGPELPEFIQR